MIRPFTCICLVLAAGSGLYLYQVKQRAFALDASLRTTFHDIDVARERTRMLRADWALMNDPERLQALAGEYLKLQPMQPSQLMTMDRLAATLPAPVAAAPSPPPGALVPDGTAPAAAKPAPLLDPTHGMPMAEAVPAGHPASPEVALLQPTAPAPISIAPVSIASLVAPAAPAAAAAKGPPVAAVPPPRFVPAALLPPPKPLRAPPPALHPVHRWTRHSAPVLQTQPWIETAAAQPDRSRYRRRRDAPSALGGQLYAANAPLRAEPRITPRAATVMYSPALGSSLGMASSASLAPPRPLYSTTQ